jgi:hypothetical protein
VQRRKNETRCQPIESAKIFRRKKSRQDDMALNPQSSTYFLQGVLLPLIPSNQQQPIFVSQAFLDFRVGLEQSSQILPWLQGCHGKDETPVNPESAEKLAAVFRM